LLRFTTTSRRASPYSTISSSRFAAVDTLLLLDSLLSSGSTLDRSASDWLTLAPAAAGTAAVRALAAVASESALSEATLARMAFWWPSADTPRALRSDVVSVMSSCPLTAFLRNLALYSP
jgi:hypothetical protein